MILDKTSILAILKTDERHIVDGSDNICITTRFNDHQTIRNQVGVDSIDLRIDETGYIMESDYEYINTLSDSDFKEYFKKVELPDTGYILKPGSILFVATVERIHLTGKIIGRITGRSVFSRFGISVHCTQDKFASGINSVACLQIINHSPIPLKIFPFQKMAQLMIENTEHDRHPYTNGTFSQEREYTLPIVKDSDRVQYDDRHKTKILRQKPQKHVISNLRKTILRQRAIWQMIIQSILVAGIGWFSSKSDLVATIAFAGVHLLVSIMFIRLNSADEGKNE